MKQQSNIIIPKILSLFDQYNLGDFIDAKDNQGDWRVGYIIDKNQQSKIIKVRFDGWASKYDEMYKFINGKNNKLKQFRSLVVGYTGQKQNPGIRSGWKFSIIQHQQKTIILYNIIQKDLSFSTRHQFNQFIRGHNYFYCDYLMTLTYKSQNELHKVIEFFKLNLKYVCGYIKQIEENVERFMKNVMIGADDEGNTIQFVNDNAYFEVLDMGYTILGAYERLVGFFKDNQELLRREFQITVNVNIKHYYINKFTDYFVKCNGFSSLQKLVRSLTKSSTLIPFRVIFSICHLYTSLTTCINIKAKLSIIQSLKLLTQRSILLLSQKQLKDFNYQQSLNLLQQFAYISKKTGIDDEVREWVENKEMEIYYKMIKCQYFQKKLKGLTMLMDFVELKVDRLMENQKKNQGNKIIDKNNNTNHTKLSLWLQQTRLFQILFSSDNAQIFKKSTQLLRFLYCRSPSLTYEYIFLLWQLRIDKHQTIIKQIYSFISEIPSYQKSYQSTFHNSSFNNSLLFNTQQFLIKLFSQYLSIMSLQSKQSYTIEYIKMIKDYTINALNYYNKKNITYFYGFQIVYEYLMKYVVQNQQENSHSDLIQGYLINMLHKIDNQDYIDQIYKRFLEYIDGGNQNNKYNNNNINNNNKENKDIRNNKDKKENVAISMVLKMLKERLIDVKTIGIYQQNSNHKNNIVKLILNNIVIRKNISNINDNGNIIQNNNNNLNNDNTMMSERFQLLSQILKQLQQSLLLDDFLTLFTQFTHSLNRKQLFKFLLKPKDNGRIILSNFLNLQTRVYLLQNLWCCQYFQKQSYFNNFDIQQSIFLLQLFKNINASNKKIQRINVISHVIDNNLDYVRKLFIAYEYCMNKQAEDYLAKGIVQVYMSDVLKNNVNNIKENNKIDCNGLLLNKFIQKLFDDLIHFMNQNDINKIVKWIKLIEETLLRDEEIYTISFNVRKLVIKDIIVKNINTSEQKIIKYNYQQCFYNFKKLISQKFNIALNKFDVIFIENNQKVTYDQYFTSLSQIGLPLKILIKPRPIQQTQHTALKISLNHHLQLLFQLLGRKQIQQSVWSIVSKLPISDDLRNKIINCNNIFEFLSNQSFYKELYMFKVALSVGKMWWNGERVNVKQLIGYFLEKGKKVEMKSQLEREYVMVTNKLIEQVINISNITNNQVNDLHLYQNIIITTLKIVNNMLQQTKNTLQLNIQIISKSIQSFFIFCSNYNELLKKNNLLQNSQQKSAFGLILFLQDKQIKIADFFKLLLIEYRHQKIRKQFSIKLAKLAMTNKQKHYERLADLIFNDLLDYSVSFQHKSHLREYNTFSVYILDSIHILLCQKWLINNSQQLFMKLFTLIQSQPLQYSSQSTSMSLYCYLSLIRFVLYQVSDMRLSLLFQYLYNECLFNGMLSKCKSKQSKNAVFNVFIKLMKNYQHYQEKIIQKFGQLHKNAIWRTRRLDDWTVIANDRLKSTTGYVGLRNLGCICYMNSFFQQIFMVKDFRMALLEAAENITQTNIDKNQSVLYQVQKMFLNLMFSDKKAYNPKPFCLAFKDYQGNPTNVSQQMDIDQFSGILFDRLQNSLKSNKNPSYQHLIKNTFGGIFSNQIICKGCPHFSQSQQSFLSLSLTVKDKKSIHQSLQTMIKGDTLDGDNMYYCQRCDKKVSAVKRVCLKQLPDNLIITLKRFEFDYMTMTKLKINQYCQFPMQLNLQQYSYEYLRKKQNSQRQRQRKIENEIEEQIQQTKNKKYYQYKLKGVVIHLGYADNGHYYSLIQERNQNKTEQEKWMEFNDSFVRKFNLENLNEEAFGGETGGVESKEKIKNAYMLIYERVQKINSTMKISKQKLQYQQEQYKQSQLKIKNNQTFRQVFQTIKQQNSQYQVQSILFSAQYQRFMSFLIDEAKLKPKNIQLQKFIILQFLTIIVRSKSQPGPFQLLHRIYTSFISQNSIISSWLIEQFTQSHIFQQFFRSNPIRETRKILIFFLLQIFKYVQDLQIKNNFILMMINKLSVQNQNLVEIIMFLYYVVDDGYFKMVIEKNVVGRILENVNKIDKKVFGEKFVESRLNQQNKVKQENYLGHEQIIQTKKLKYDNQQGYVWGLLYKVLAKFNHDQAKIQKYLHEQQISYIYLRKQKIFKILQQLKSKIDIDFFTNYLSYLSYNHDSLTLQLLNLCQKGLKQFQSKRYRQFFILFSKLLQIQDKLTQKRTTLGIHYLIKSLKQNQKYAMDCTIIQLWLGKIISDQKNDKLRNYLRKEKYILDYLINLALRKVPSDQLSKKNVINLLLLNFNDQGAFIESLVSKYHGIPFPTSKKGYIKILTQLRQFYQKMAQGQQYYQKLQLFESGNHIIGQKIQKDMKIAYFDKLQYEEYTVINMFLHKIYIVKKTTNNNKPILVWDDDQKLTLSLKAIRKENQYDLDSSKTTEMEDEDQFD